jgi:hypothetical protein
MLLVDDQLVVEGVVEQIPENGSLLAYVLDAVRTLPLGVSPLGVRDISPTRQPAPIGFDKLSPDVIVRDLATRHA